jgi:hypothetical protein
MTKNTASGQFKVVPDQVINFKQDSFVVNRAVFGKNVRTLLVLKTQLNILE